MIEQSVTRIEHDQVQSNTFLLSEKAAGKGAMAWRGQMLTTGVPRMHSRLSIPPLAITSS